MVVEIQGVFDRGGIGELCEPVWGIKQEDGVIEAVLELLQDSQLHSKTKLLKEIGISFGEAGECEKAIACFDKAIELNPVDAKAYNDRGLAYLDLEQYELAIENCDKAIELNPKLTEPYNNRGLAYAYLKQYGRAIEDYDKAIKLDPNHTRAYVNRELAISKLQEHNGLWGLEAGFAIA